MLYGSFRKDENGVKVREMCILFVTKKRKEIRKSKSIEHFYLFLFLLIDVSKSSGYQVNCVCSLCTFVCVFGEI